eukprot:TRINITY_DN1683_c0_g1_i1.p1 TRINITY_DN1683_c0_g1~~TRINITY_DN1683_c0_g1_i1.p1  ORF type:complete len:1537 (+),score=375.87 TRINITY_DN1683_c0_g1_i1:161-4771(+)
MTDAAATAKAAWRLLSFDSKGKNKDSNDNNNNSNTNSPPADNGSSLSPSALHKRSKSHETRSSAPNDTINNPSSSSSPHNHHHHNHNHHHPHHQEQLQASSPSSRRASVFAISSTHSNNNNSFNGDDDGVSVSPKQQTRRGIVRGGDLASELQKARARKRLDSNGGLPGTSPHPHNHGHNSGGSVGGSSSSGVNEINSSDESDSASGPESGVEVSAANASDMPSSSKPSSSSPYHKKHHQPHTGSGGEHGSQVGGGGGEGASTKSSGSRIMASNGQLMSESLADDSVEMSPETTRRKGSRILRKGGSLRDLKKRKQSIERSLASIPWGTASTSSASDNIIARSVSEGGDGSSAVGSSLGGGDMLKTSGSEGVLHRKREKRDTLRGVKEKRKDKKDKKKEKRERERERVSDDSQSQHTTSTPPPPPTAAVQDTSSGAIGGSDRSRARREDIAAKLRSRMQQLDAKKKSLEEDLKRTTAEAIMDIPDESPDIRDDNNDDDNTADDDEDEVDMMKSPPSPLLMGPTSPIVEHRRSYIGETVPLPYRKQTINAMAIHSSDFHVALQILHEEEQEQQLPQSQPPFSPKATSSATESTSTSTTATPGGRSEEDKARRRKILSTLLSDTDLLRSSPKEISEARERAERGRSIGKTAAMKLDRRVVVDTDHHHHHHHKTDRTTVSSSATSPRINAINNNNKASLHASADSGSSSPSSRVSSIHKTSPRRLMKDLKKASFSGPSTTGDAASGNNIPTTLTFGTHQQQQQSTEYDEPLSPRFRASSPRGTSANHSFEEELQKRQYARLQRVFFQHDLLVAHALCLSLPQMHRDRILPRIARLLIDKSVALPLIQRLIAYEVSNAVVEDGAGTLFRSNSPVCNLMSHHARIVGKSFIGAHIGPLVQSILHGIDHGTQYEVNPTMLDGDEASNASRIEANGENIILAAEKILNTLDAVLPTFPKEIRLICHELHAQVILKFPEATHSTIGGYLFLRYICPAIVSPEIFDLVEGPISKDGRRALLLISKVLQQMGNGLTFESKEPYMGFLNPFIEANINPLRSFFHSVAAKGQDDDELKFEVSDKVTLSDEEREDSAMLLHILLHENIESVEQHFEQLRNSFVMSPRALGYNPVIELKDCLRSLVLPASSNPRSLGSKRGRSSQPPEVNFRRESLSPPHSPRDRKFSEPIESNVIRQQQHTTPSASDTAGNSDDNPRSSKEELATPAPVTLLNRFQSLDDVALYLQNKDRAQQAIKESRKRRGSVSSSQQSSLTSGGGGGGAGGGSGSVSGNGGVSEGTRKQRERKYKARIKPAKKIIAERHKQVPRPFGRRRLVSEVKLVQKCTVAVPVEGMSLDEIEAQIRAAIIGREKDPDGNVHESPTELGFALNTGSRSQPNLPVSHRNSIYHGTTSLDTIPELSAPPHHKSTSFHSTSKDSSSSSAKKEKKKRSSKEGSTLSAPESPNSNYSGGGAPGPVISPRSRNALNSSAVPRHTMSPLSHCSTTAVNGISEMMHEELGTKAERHKTKMYPRTLSSPGPSKGGSMIYRPS